MKLFPKTKDERVVAEINRIYKIGFFFLTFGILLDVVLQAIGIRLEGTTMGDSSINLLEFGILLAAQLVILLMMNRKGLMDDNAYAEADRYPWKHYLGVYNTVLQRCGLGVHECAAYPAGFCSAADVHGADHDRACAAADLCILLVCSKAPPENRAGD